MSKALTYGNYLRLTELLDLQTPRSDGPEHDEMLFIVVHQVYELWFKEMLHELKHLQNLLGANDPARASHTLKRILSILKTIVAQLDVMETMTPMEFGAFRGFLDSSSGFQSAQFREIEFAFGYRRDEALRAYAEGTPERQRLETMLTTPSLWDAFLHYLVANGYAIPSEQLSWEAHGSIEASADVQHVLIGAYRSSPEVRNVCEGLVDVDEGFQEWRYRHMKMVERTIGIRIGTGGSAGVGYLLQTIKPFFPDLWAIRSQL